MNTYELEIHIKDQIYEEEHQHWTNKFCHHIVCEDKNLEKEIGNLYNCGVIIDIKDYKRFLPSLIIQYIDVKILERVQSPDIADSIKSVLTDKK